MTSATPDFAASLHREAEKPFVFWWQVDENDKRNDNDEKFGNITQTVRESCSQSRRASLLLSSAGKITVSSCDTVWEQLQTNLRKLQTFSFCLFTRDIIVASTGFAELFEFLVTQFCVHMQRLIRSVKRSDVSENTNQSSDKIVHLDVREPAAFEESTVDASLVRPGHAHSRSAKDGEEAIASDNKYLNVRISFCDAIFSFLKQSSLLHWFLLRSRAFQCLSKRIQKQFVQTVLDHLYYCFQMHHDRQESSNQTSNKANDIRSRGISNMLSFDLALLSCILQNNPEAVNLVRHHQRYVDIAREVFQLLSPKGSGHNEKEKCPQLSATTIYALAFICEVVNGTTVGMSFFSEENLSYAFHVMLTVVAARPYTTRKNIGEYDDSTTRNIKKTNLRSSPSLMTPSTRQMCQKIPVASLVQRLCAGVVKQLASASTNKASSTDLVEWCLRKRGMRRLLEQLIGDIEASPIESPTPVRNIGTDGCFGTPIQNGRGKFNGIQDVLQYPRYHHASIEFGMLSLYSSRFELLTALLLTTGSATICSEILLAGNQSLIEWLIAILTLRPPKTMRKKQNLKKSDYNRDKSFARDRAYQTSKSTMEQHSLLRAGYSIECFQAACSLLSSLLLLNASGSVANFLCSSKTRRSKPKRSNTGLQVKSKKNRRLRGTPTKSNDGRDCVLSRIIADNLVLLAQAHYKHHENGFFSQLRTHLAHTPVRSPPRHRLRKSPSRATSKILKEQKISSSTLSAIIAVSLVQVIEAALDCGNAALAQDVANELVFRNPTLFWLIKLYAARSHKELNGFQHTLSCIVNATADSPDYIQESSKVQDIKSLLRSSQFTFFSMVNTEDASFYPKQNNDELSGTQSQKIANDTGTRASFKSSKRADQRWRKILSTAGDWMDFSHSLAATLVLKITARSLCVASSSTSLSALDISSLANVQQNDTRFALTLGEAVTEAIQHLQVFLQAPNEAASDSDSNVTACDQQDWARVFKGGCNSAARAMWNLTGLTSTRTSTSSFRWLKQCTSGLVGDESYKSLNVEGRTAKDMFSTSETETSDFKNVMQSGIGALALGNVQQTPILPLVASVMSGRSSLVLAAISCLNALSEVAVNLSTSYNNPFYNRELRADIANMGGNKSKIQQGSNAQPRTIVTSINTFTFQFAAGLQSSILWLFDCLDASLTSHHASQYALMHERQEWLSKYQDSITYQQNREMKLKEIVQRERQSLTNAVATSRLEVKRALDRERKAILMNEELNKIAEERHRELQKTQEQALQAQHIHETLVCNAKNLEQKVAALEEENTSLREQANNLGQTVADMADNAKLSSVSDHEDLQTAYNELKHHASVRAAQLEGHVRHLNSRMTTLESERETALGNAEKTGAKATELRNSVDSYRRRTEELSGKLIVMAQVHNALEQKIMHMESTITKLKMQNEVNSTTSEAQIRQAVFEAEKAAKQKFARERQENQTKLTKVEQAYAQAEGQIERLSRAKELAEVEAREEKENLEQKLTAMANTIAALKSDADTKQKKHEEEVTLLRAKVGQGEALAVLLRTISVQHEAGENLKVTVDTLESRKCS